MANKAKAHVAVNKVSCTAQGSPSWFLEGRKPPHQVTKGNALQFFICGQEGFGQLHKDLENAKQTVDICCWGFDPGMELVRSAGGQWPRGETYGDLLVRLATRKHPVKIRLLIWHNTAASDFNDTMPGYTDVAYRRAPIIASPYQSSKRHKYCQQWWDKNLLPLGKLSSSPSNLQIILRDVSGKEAIALLDTEPREQDRPDKIEWALFYASASHHQKPVLIDYGLGKDAVGYVMGLNSVTDYWDTLDHFVDTKLRETGTDKYRNKELSRLYDSEINKGASSPDAQKAAIHAAYFHSIVPLQDYACRIQGPALESVHQNFEDGWSDAIGKRANLPATLRLSSDSTYAGPPPNATNPSAACQVQIVRTQAQAHKKDKTIKELYFHSVEQAKHYIYMENQYFFYPEFARHLKKMRTQYHDAWCSKSGKSPQHAPMLHVFIVIPFPQMTQLVPRTFDTLTELGNSDAMPGQMALVDQGLYNQDYPGARTVTIQMAQNVTGDPVPRKRKVLYRPSVDDLARTLGMKVSVAHLCTSNPGNRGDRLAYREIYIHSKLMLIDDVFVTLGSANMNQRSMSVDSEINMAATDPQHVSKLRRRIFNLHTKNSKIDWTAGDGNAMQRMLPDAFTLWNKRASDNYNAMTMGQQRLQGFLTKLVDMRQSSVRFS